ncbi:trigger factor [Thorsellia kenyensis]|uniref:Trigger factor n=1 Tax=Thorsellia kenyensis TaxID=1549888 RepID=A0ABV6C793_9GAMM
MSVADENTPAVATENEKVSSELVRKATLTITADAFAKAMQSELIRASKTVRVDGFRKGKVPLNIVEQRFGASIMQDVIGGLLQRTYFDYLSNEKIMPASDPTFNVHQFEPNSDINFEVEYEIFPEIKLQDLDKIEIEKKVAEVEESDVDEMLNTLRKQQATWVVSEAVASKEARVTIDFVGQVDGEVFEGGEAKDFVLVMNENRMIPGFEDAIVGRKAGESFDINVTFPEDYQSENLKGKAAIFKTTLTKVEERELPEFSASFIKRFGVKDGTLESLRAEVKKNMIRELKAVIKNNVKAQIFDGLLANHKVTVPNAVVKREIDNLKKQALARFGNANKMDPSNLPDALFEEEAKRRSSIGLLLSEAISHFELKVDEELVKTMIEEIASAYENPAEVVKHYNKDKNLMNSIRNVALEQQAVDTIEGKAKVTEVKSSFAELLKQNPSMGM